MAYRSKVLDVAAGGTGANTLTGVVVGNGTSAMTATATPSVTSITLGGGTALANYLQGTFTPAIAFGGGTTGITYNNQTGVYTRIGRVVFFNVTVGITSKGSSTGAATLTGLPLAASGAGQYVIVNNGGGITYPATYLQLLANLNNGATTAALIATTSVSGNTNLTDVEFNNTTTFNVNGFYAV